MIIQRRGPTTLLDRVRGPFAVLGGIALLVSGAFFLVAGEFSVPSRLALGAALLFFGMYVAIDPANPHGAWWWEPGKTGCASRSTGPTVFPADRADVRTAADTTDVQFEIRLHSGNAAPIKLTIAHDTIRREPSGEQVPIEHRRDLDIP